MNLPDSFRPPDPAPMAELLRRRPEIEMSEQQASDFHERLVKMITSAQEKLGPEQEIGVRLVSFGQTLILHLESYRVPQPRLDPFPWENQRR